MMLVRMRGGYYDGEVKDVPVPVGRHLLKTGRAELPRVDEEVETTAIDPAPEKAIRRRGRPRKHPRKVG
jgi:hypothetical protein